MLCSRDLPLEMNYWLKFSCWDWIRFAQQMWLTGLTAPLFHCLTGVCEFCQAAVRRRWCSAQSISAETRHKGLATTKSCDEKQIKWTHMLQKDSWHITPLFIKFLKPFLYMYLYTKPTASIWSCTNVIDFFFSSQYIQFLDICPQSTALWARGQSPPTERKPPQIKVLVYSKIKIHSLSVSS